MTSVTISLAGQSVRIDYPDAAQSAVELIFGACATSTAPPRAEIGVRALGDDAWEIRTDTATTGPVTARDLPAELLSVANHQVTQAFATPPEAGEIPELLLRAGAVAWQGAAVLIPGPPQGGKSSLGTWYTANGLDYLTDDVVVLADNGSIEGFHRPPAVTETSVRPVLPGEHSPSSTSKDYVLIQPPAETGGTQGEIIARRAERMGLILVPWFSPDIDLAVDPLLPAEAQAILMQCNLSARGFNDGGSAALARLSQTVPALTVRFGAFSQLDRFLKHMTLHVLSARMGPADTHKFAAEFVAGMMSVQPQQHSAPSVATGPFPIPAATPRRDVAVKMTVGMATYDDYDGVFFTLQALQLYHPELAGKVEWIVVDNHPDGPCSEALKAMEYWHPHYRYIPESQHPGTSYSRDLVFREAAGEFVLCMDCHVLVVPGALARLLAYFEANPTTKDLVQGPLLDDHLGVMGTHFEPHWDEGMWGQWKNDPRATHPDAPPFDIPMQGLGLFACRKEAWAGFNPLFRGFGGEEGYIHEKFRQRGGRTLCLPFLRWVHRFNRPMGVRYVNRWEDRIRNYMIGHKELGLPLDPIEAHFRVHLGDAQFEQMIAPIRTELESLYPAASAQPNG